MTTYTYLGDRFTSPELKGKTCTSVRRPDGKCIRGANGNMLVSFDGVQQVVLARLLRKAPNCLTASPKKQPKKKQ